MAKTPERKGKPKSNPSTPKKTMGQKAAHEAWDWFKAFLYAAVAVVIVRLFVFETMMVPTGSMIPTIVPLDRLFVERVTYSTKEPDYGEIVVFWTPFVDKEAQKQLRAFDKFMDIFSPAEYRGHVKYVKRLVGKPGDVLELTPNLSGGGYSLLVNGQTPERLKGVTYQKEGIFKDPRFYHQMAYPSEYPWLTANMKSFFEFYNKALDYTAAYREVFDGLEIGDYAWKVADSDRIQIRVPEGGYFFMGDNSPESLDSRFFGFVPKKNIVGGPLLRIWPLNRFGPINKQ
ncbi:MAG: Signal peptidase I [Thermotogae bacterium ADurb.Bin062]|jgi:signal peptidase I|nr:MAG: Signal peptidase I [Thermotogota bacterium ADurb.Bin062]